MTASISGLAARTTSLLVMFGCAFLATRAGRAQPLRAPVPRPFAFVELFTSEGCSSCPPADQVLAEVARRSGADVYALSFHVDYWDDLGWPDPFSAPENTRRQRSYARALGGGTYTPEMIVNGAEGFVGGDRARALRTIDAALARPARVAIALSVERRGDVVTAHYRTAGAPAAAEVAVAWVERSREVDVRRGENAGRRLRHANVVRAWSSLALGGDGAGVQALRVPAGASAGGAEVVAWVQDPTMRVLAATRAAQP